MKYLRLAWPVFLVLLLFTACAGPEEAGETPDDLPASATAEIPEDTGTPITPEEGAALLEAQLGTVDEATGNLMSYGYEGTVTLDGVSYYDYRVSWLVDDHMSYLANYLVSTDGRIIQEKVPEDG